MPPQRRPRVGTLEQREFTAAAGRRSAAGVTIRVPRDLAVRVDASDTTFGSVTLVRE